MNFPHAPLTGIVPPLVTPLKARDTLDEEGLGRLIDHVLGGGVRGLFVLGTTGEGPSLSHRLRAEVVRRACALAAGRAPVLAGITDTSFVESVDLARAAADAGAAAVVLAPPFYIPAGQPELIEYVQRLLAELPLPLVLYNMPHLTKVAYEPETVRVLMDDPRIVGMKDSSGDLAYFGRIAELLPRRPDWTLLMGPEELTAAAARLGAHGGVNGGANVHPRLFVDSLAAAQAGDPARQEPLQREIEGFAELYRIGRHASALIKGVKCALALMGICDDYLADPFRRFRAPERRRVESFLRARGLLA